MDISNIIDQYDKQLSVCEFIANTEYTIEQFYVDKFWDIIADDKWIYIDNGTLEWMGYNTIRDRKLKERYVRMLEHNFTNEVEYRHLNSSQLKDLYAKGMLQAEMSDDFNQHNKTKHLLVTPDCFKESLMLMQTAHSKKIRKYYLILEKIFKKYIKYLDAYKDRQLLETKSELEKSLRSAAQFKTMIVERNVLKQDQYVYVATNATYAKSSIFKIGMTTDIGKRLNGYTTGRCLNDKFSYVYIMKCVDAKSLEQYIFSRLENFRYDEERTHKRELFQIHINLLKNILREYEEFEKSTTDKFNTMLAEYYDTYANLHPMDLDDLIIQNVDRYIEEKFDIKPIDVYKPPEKYKTNYSNLTNEVINERLRPFGIELVSEYSGKCEDYHTFRCLSEFRHKIVNSYSVIMASKEKGCAHCRKHCILNQISIYVYQDRSYDYETQYDTFADLKAAEPDINHQIIKNIIREQRWLTPVNGKIYSVLSPHNGKLDLNKPLSEIELSIISKLEIDYDIMKNHILNVKMKYVIAIDDRNRIAYWGDSNTIMGNKLRQLNCNKPINRKTVQKYVNTNKLYGGYLWITSITNIYNSYTMIDVKNM